MAGVSRTLEIANEILMFMRCKSSPCRINKKLRERLKWQ
jgi:hypothetical protein